MAELWRIAIDVMGGDTGPSVTVPASLSALRRYGYLSLVLVGDSSLIEPYLTNLSSDERDRIQIVHTSDVVSNQSRPDSILRSGRQSSMFKAVELVQTGDVQACVSAGNTGALLMAGRHLLKNIPGIEKPAIMAVVPASSSSSNTFLLDVGANTWCSASQLFQFALMGSVLVTAMSGREKPRVALLNIGEEEYKGRPEIREAAALLAASNAMEYLGFVEGNQLFDGRSDVIVCDGFTGNVVIKVIAGSVRVTQNLVQQSLRKRWYYRFFAWWLQPLMRDVRRTLKPSRYNGAMLLGLQGIVVKSHGNADRSGFERAIEYALRQVQDDVPGVIASRMAALTGLAEEAKPV
ncbi:MAG TPA: phosphate acyltransferase PlsX [Pseudohongiella sp.]|nr:phosphate acyltransferase PlsX [Pseudohongiella sp.]